MTWKGLARSNESWPGLPMHANTGATIHLPTKMFEHSGTGVGNEKDLFVDNHAVADAGKAIADIWTIIIWYNMFF